MMGEHNGKSTPQPDPQVWAPLAVQRPPLELQELRLFELTAILRLGYNEGHGDGRLVGERAR